MFDPDKAAVICEYLAEGQSLRAICAMEGMPHESTVRMWARDDVQGFATQYTRAREIGYAAMADDILEISDYAGLDTKVSKDGDESMDGEWVARSRLRVDSRKWLLSKMLPKVYGDKVETVHSGELGIRRIERVITKAPE